jgi:hypothetical protein
MQRTFELWGDYGQRSSGSFNVTNSQNAAFDKAWDFRTAAAAIIRENWPAIYGAFIAHTWPGYTHEEIWFMGERFGLIEDPKSGREFTFTVTQSGPRFSHEIVSAGSCFRCPGKS